MSFRSYKEGQGIWARGVMAFVFFVIGVYAAFRLYDYLYVGQQSWLGDFLNISFNLGLWTVDTRLFVVGIVLIIFLGSGIWFYNYPRLVDFLIETETELRTRVTWPKKHDLINASTVVVFTVILVGIWVLLSDNLFVILFRDTIYEWF
jgi:preprotein translocase SecE subunit